MGSLDGVRLCWGYDVGISVVLLSHRPCTRPSLRAPCSSLCVPAHAFDSPILPSDVQGRVDPKKAEWNAWNGHP